MKTISSLRNSAKPGQIPAIAALLVVGLLNGCSINRIGVYKIGNALAKGGTTFSSDNDPELVRAAAPFSLKLMEALLAESPQHEGLLFATSSGFTQYAYAFARQEADEIEERDFGSSTREIAASHCQKELLATRKHPPNRDYHRL